MTPDTCETIRPPKTPENLGYIDLDQLNQEIAQMSVEQRIAKAYEISGGNLVAATTFGPTSPIMIDSAHRTRLAIPFVTIVHRHETEETLESAEFYEKEYGLDLRKYYAQRLERPPEGTIEFLEFQHKIKVEPFQDMINEIRPQVVLFGVIGYQTEERGNMKFAERRGSIIAINPLLDMTEKEVADFFERTGLPQNKNHFDPAKGASQKLECGLNQAKFGKSPQILSKKDRISALLRRIILVE